MDRRKLFGGVLGGALGLVAARFPVEANPLPDADLTSWGFDAKDPEYRSHFIEVPGYGWKEVTGTGMLLPLNPGVSAERIYQRTFIARSTRKNLLEAGVVERTEYGNWFVPDVEGDPNNPSREIYKNWAHLHSPEGPKVLVRDHGVLAGSPSPFSFRWDWVQGYWLYNAEGWTEDQV